MSDSDKTKAQLLDELKKLSARVAELEQLETGRKAIEEALRASEAKYRQVFATESDAIMILDVDSDRFADANDAALRLYGYSKDEFLKLQPTDISAEPEKSRVAIDGAVSGKIDKVPRRYHKKRDGTVFPVEISFGKFTLNNCKMICAVIRDITERREAEEALRESEEKFRGLAEQSPNMIFINRKGRVVYVNQKCEEIMGYKREEFYSPHFDFLTLVAPESRDLIRSNLARHLNGEEVEPYEYSLITKDGQGIEAIINTRLINYEGERSILGIVTDVTENKRLEAQLRWSQKMETVGRLAGGVAHDFNNMLTTIRGYAELGMMGLQPTERLHGDLQEILRAADRAAALTRQLLAFSRRQIVEPRVINLNDILLDMDKMLRRLIGEDIELVTLPAENLGPIRVDPGQIQQVLVNLSVNARDAMPDGGKIILETANVTLDQSYARKHVGVTPGDYVMLAVRDTGAGMTEEVKKHLFEPFFTTKEVGKGTGLGLATCYGIVKQSRGNIWVESDPDRGTTFRIYLPRVEEEVEALPKREEDAAGELPGGTETILLVEDESSVRMVTARALREQGYSVLEATTGEEALRVARDHGRDQIHLLLTDVVMPQMGGQELADRLREVRPEMKVLLFSGYTDESVAYHNVLEPGTAFLQKPFTRAVLARKARELLDR